MVTGNPGADRPPSIKYTFNTAVVDKFAGIGGVEVQFRQSSNVTSKLSTPIHL
jgi:hypothetical protein